MNNYEFEEKLYNEGYKYIAGTDEVGRGCIAGPVVACAIIMPQGVIIEGVTDSKLLTDKKRRLLKEEILNQALCYKITMIDPAEIDRINILEASRKAMLNSIQNLAIKPDYILADAMKLPIDIPQMSLIKGDLRSHTIGCASIVAKVIRDDLMIEYAKTYPGYDLEKNKGYPTPFHKQALYICGISDIHRQSYAPVKEVLEKSLNTHNMRLWPNPFNSIKEGVKTIEMRLNDSKRQNIKVNDLIIFENIETSEKLEVVVQELKVFQTFADLYTNYDKLSLGYADNEEAIPSDMEQFYTKKDIAKYGVLAIKIKVINK